MKKILHRYSCLLAFLLMVIPNLALANTPARPKISFSCGSISPETPLYKTVESIYRQAFTRLGYEFEMINAPNLKRALAEARYGGTDGDCARVDFLNDWIADSGLVRVNVKILETSLSVWANDSTLQINTAAALAANNLVIGYPRGTLITERYISTHKLAHPLPINTPESAIKMLLAHRYDLLLISTDVAVQELKRLHMEGVIFNVGTLERYDVYPYLNEKYKALLPQLESELKKLVPPHGIDTNRAMPALPPR